MLHICLYMPSSAHFWGYTNFTAPSKYKGHIEPLKIVAIDAENISCLVYAKICIENLSVTVSESSFCSLTYSAFLIFNIAGRQNL